MTARDLQLKLEDLGMKLTLQKPAGSKLWTARITAGATQQGVTASADVTCEHADPESAIKGALAKVQHTVPNVHKSGPIRSRFQG